MNENSARNSNWDLLPFIELNNRKTVLKFKLGADCYYLGRESSWSSFEIPQTGWDVISRHHAVLRREGEDYRIYDGNGSKLSKNGIFINYTRINPDSGYPLRSGDRLEIGQDPANQVQLSYINPTTGRQPQVISRKPFLSLQSITDWPIELGRSPSNRYASMQLEAPTVSRNHATIDRDDRGRYLLRDYSMNGTFVNRTRVDRPVVLRDGDTIRIGPFLLLFQAEFLELFDRGSQLRLDAHNLSRKVIEKSGEKLILDRVSLAIEPGQLIALVGSSGAGKSTLLKTLLGVEPITGGTVYLNGDNLQRNFNLYRAQIGYVPQDDIVHQNLTVEEVLGYACKLRLPPDINIAQVIELTLAQVQLTHVRTTLVRNLSGGQRKRVSIAVELLADPKLFFLDEPTSGLDPGLDKEIMKLLQNLAKQQGRTIVLVTHATANIEVCDRVAFLGRGGRLCYFGPPQEAMTFFEMPSQDLKYFSDIYLKLEKGRSETAIQQEVNSWENKFVNSSIYQKYVKAPLSPGKQTQKSTIKPERKVYPSLRQLILLSQRYLHLIWRDRSSLVFSLIPAPLGIWIMSLILREKHFPAPTSLQEEDFDKLEALQSPQVINLLVTEGGLKQAATQALLILFVVTCFSIWLGIANSVQEIVKESAIYKRERLVNLGLFPYIGSKVLIRSILALIQASLIAIALLIGFDAPHQSDLPWTIGLEITTFLTLVASTCLGLAISSFAKNENQANDPLPIILLFQIILSGAVFTISLESQDSLKNIFASLTMSRWAMRAYGSLADVQAIIPRHSVNYEIYKADWDNVLISWSFLILHITIYLIIIFWKQKLKDIRK